MQKDNPKWNELAREEQDLYLTVLWKDEYSEKAIADFLGTTKGVIVRRRQTGLKLKAGKKRKAKQTVNAERFFDLLELHAMRQIEKRGVIAIAPVRESARIEARETGTQTPEQRLFEAKRRLGSSWPADFNPRALASTEARQCTESVDGKQCARVRLPGFDKCYEHVHLP